MNSLILIGSDDDDDEEISSETSSSFDASWILRSAAHHRSAPFLLLLLTHLCQQSQELGSNPPYGTTFPRKAETAPEKEQEAQMAAVESVETDSETGASNTQVRRDDKASREYSVPLLEVSWSSGHA